MFSRFAKIFVFVYCFGFMKVFSGLALVVSSMVTNQFSEPYGVCIDDTGVIYISDASGHRIVKYIPDSGVLTNFAGLIGKPGSDNGTNYFARFNSPHGLVIARGGIVVADTGNHKLRFISFNGVVSDLAGSGVRGSNDGPALAAQFNAPISVAADTFGNVYIADSQNNSLRKLDTLNNVTTIYSGLNDPWGVAVTPDGLTIFVTERRDNVIRKINLDSSGYILTNVIIAGRQGMVGYNDTIFADEATFNWPADILYLGGTTGLLVSDTGNNVIRRIFTNPDLVGITDFSVETYAGVAGQGGLKDGDALSALFSCPAGLARNSAGSIIVADSGNKALRAIQSGSIVLPVSDPKIGIIEYVKDAFGERVTKLQPIAQAVFNNDVTIAILTEQGAETYFTFGPTPVGDDNIPAPSATTGHSPPAYSDGLPEGQEPPSLISPMPDVTIKARSFAEGRAPSQIVTARFQFKVSNPTIDGDNPVQFTVLNRTDGAVMYYTVDGSDPTNVVTENCFGPLFNGSVVSLKITDKPIIFKIQAFKSNYKPSSVQQKIFYPKDVSYNKITFGFEGGEASSKFIAAVGQTFYAPITLSLLPNQQIYSLQFNLTVTNLGSQPVAPGAIGFSTMLVKPVKIGGELVYVPIDPSMYFYDFTTGTYQQTDLLFTNTAINLLGVGWLERYSKTNLFDTTKQDLVTYSIAHDTLWLSSAGKVVVGGFHFDVPPTAQTGDVYQIKIGRPSATSDGISKDVFIDTPTNGSLYAGPINSIKNVVIGTPQYIVGDVAPFQWLNAGDFGDTNILNNDVLQIFQSACYLLNMPPANSDFYNAMDACNGSQLPLANYYDINNILYGDGELNVDDVYVTFRRSLDPSLKWVRRYWSSFGNLIAVADVTNTFRGVAALTPASTIESDIIRNDLAASSGQQYEPPSVRFEFPDTIVNPGTVVSVPLFVKVGGVFPLRVLMLRINVEPLEDTPPLTENIKFTPVSDIGNPSFKDERISSFAGAWLNSTIPGLKGSNILGYLTIKVPTNATENSVYRISFKHVSASPNGIALFPRIAVNGLLSTKDLSVSTVNDGIPDSWRLRHFGKRYGPETFADSDPDNDGMNNKAEFKAGTDPLDVKSSLRLVINKVQKSNRLNFSWQSSLNRKYCLEFLDDFNNGLWTPIESNIVGNGLLQGISKDFDTNACFFRLKLQD